MELSGYVAPGFGRVAEEFSRNFTERGDLGASFAVIRDDEPLVDLWGGIADRATRRAWTADTLQILFSGTKGLVAACVLLLMERGQLALESPVARYWPEFAAAGKSDVLVRDLVTHTAGLPGLDVPRDLARGDRRTPDGDAAGQAAAQRRSPGHPYLPRRHLRLALRRTSAPRRTDAGSGSSSPRRSPARWTSNCGSAFRPGPDHGHRRSNWRRHGPPSRTSGWPWTRSGARSGIRPDTSRTASRGTSPPGTRPRFRVPTASAPHGRSRGSTPAWSGSFPRRPCNSAPRSSAVATTR